MPAPRRAWRVGEDEEAHLTDGEPGGAEISSRGFLPLRPRSEARHHARPAFPGTAVVLGETTYEVLSEAEAPDRGLVLYRLRPWPEGEVQRDRVVYGRAFVRQAEAERQRARVHARVRPFRWLFYPLVGLLPEDEQVRVCDRLGLYAVTATLVSGFAESVGILWALSRLGRGTSDPVATILFVALTPGLVALLFVPAFGRALGAVFLKEVGGSGPVTLLFELLHALGWARARGDAGFVPLTRRAFWERLTRPDSVTTSPDGTLVYRGLLAHLSWTGSHPLQFGGDHWWAIPLAPERDRGRLVFSYRLEPVAASSGDTSRPPSPTAYADEVLGGVRVEWDAFNRGFSWLTSLLSADIQTRAFGHRGGPAAARRPTMISSLLCAVLGLYLLSFLPGGSAADPLAPFVAVAAFALVIDAIRRVSAARQGRYAPSLLRALLPSDTLPPERVAYHAHRDAEREVLALLTRL